MPTPRRRGRPARRRQARLSAGHRPALGAAATAGLAVPAAAEAAPGPVAPGPRQPPFHARRHARHAVPLRRAEHPQGAGRGVAALSAGAGRGRQHRVPVPPGDLTQNGAKEEVAAISEAFGLLDRRGVGYSVLAGNHYVPSSSTDRRGATPYLDAFGPQRFRGRPTFGGASPDGYKTFHLFRAAGREWMVLALDWAVGTGVRRAADVLARHPRTPVVLTTHELVVEDDALSAYGQQLWDRLIAGHDQIFLTLNGHYWPAGRATRKNAAGHDVHLHLTNYQNRYFGGAAMIRLYRFDLDRNVIDVETVSPWILGRAAQGLDELERQEIELSGDADRFTVGVDFAERSRRIRPVPACPARPARRSWCAGTVAYWRFDGHADGSAVSGTVRDLSGGATTSWSSRSAAERSAGRPTTIPTSPDTSLEFRGFKSPLKGAYLRTVDGAPLNAATFAHGYTVEVFYRFLRTGIRRTTPGRGWSAGPARAAPRASPPTIRTNRSPPSRSPTTGNRAIPDWSK